MPYVVEKSITSPQTKLIGKTIERCNGEGRTRRSKKIDFILLVAQRDELCARAKTRTGNVLCHECVIDGDDVDLVDALRLELVVLLDVTRSLRAARGRERSRHANLLFVGIYMFSWTVDVT
jgi:hypothetical protein